MRFSRLAHSSKRLSPPERSATFDLLFFAKSSVTRPVTAGHASFLDFARVAAKNFSALHKYRSAIRRGLTKYGLAEADHGVPNRPSGTEYRLAEGHSLT